MKAEWRTGVVVELCRSMRQSREYGITPILADALDEAGCDDQSILDALRAPVLNTIMAERLVAIVYDPSTEFAVKVIEEIASQMRPGVSTEEGEYGEEMPVTYERMMGWANKWVDGRAVDEALGRQWWSRHHTTENGGESWQDEFPSYARNFWEHYRKITGKSRPERGTTEDAEEYGDYDDDNFFSCTC